MLRFTSIESLRAWMAYWVVLGHAPYLAGISAEGGGVFMPLTLRLFNRGNAAVNVLIIVSGFVITHLLLSRKEYYLPYVTRRWFRIFPIFFVSLLIAILLQPFYLVAYTDFEWVRALEPRQSSRRKRAFRYPPDTPPDDATWDITRRNIKVL